MNCKHSENDLALYVEGDLPQAKAEEVDVHLLTCSDCRQIVDELGRSQSLFKSIRQETVGTAELADLRMRVMERAMQRPKPFWGRWVYGLAGATFVVLLITGVLARESHRGETSVKVVKRVPLPLPAAQVVVPPAKEESRDLVKVTMRRRRRPPLEQLKPLKSPLKSMMVKLQTDDPNIVIYWLFDQNGGSL